MAYGACPDCGCSKEECECVPLFAFDLIYPERQRFTAHGTFLRDYECFQIVRKLEVPEAHALMSKSLWLSEKTAIASERMLEVNEWVVVEINRDKGYVEAVSRTNKYALYRAGAQAFIKAIHQASAYNKILRALFDAITQPNENA